MRSLDDFARDKLDRLDAPLLRRRLVDSPREDGVWIVRDGRRLLSFSCNDYLNLTQHPAIKAAVERADFMMIVAGDPPDFRTISEFRRRHLKALAALFVQVLKLAEKAGLVKLGHVALDGTKIKANASKHKAMSYDRMKKREAELAAEVDRWLKAAEAADAEEDKLYGSRRGDEMPDWVADKQKRLQKIREARAALEAEAEAAAEEEMRRREKAEEERKTEGRKKNGKTPAPPKAEPEGKTQRNFTDPESRILKTKDGYIQGYNAQAAVDAQAQIIVARA
jgi:hypothetical protein